MPFWGPTKQEKELSGALSDAERGLSIAERDRDEAEKQWKQYLEEGREKDDEYVGRRALKSFAAMTVWGLISLAGGVGVNYVTSHLGICEGGVCGPTVVTGVAYAVVMKALFGRKPLNWIKYAPGVFWREVMPAEQAWSGEEE